MSKVVYVGGSAGAAWLDKIGVNYQQSVTADSVAGTANAELLLIGPDAALDTASLRAHLEEGGKVFFLPRSQAEGGLGAALKPAAAHFAGSLSVPEWPEAKGLSASDLRWRTHMEAAPWVVSAGADIGADGLIGRKVIGKGVAVFCQVDPDRFQADQQTYFRSHGGGPPVPWPNSWPIWAPVSGWTAAYFIPLTLWLLTWMACGRRR